MDGFRRAVAEARKSGNLCFAGLLLEHRIKQAFGEARELWQGWIYTPAVTIWVFSRIWYSVLLARYIRISNPPHPRSPPQPRACRCHHRRLP